MDGWIIFSYVPTKFHFKTETAKWNLNTRGDDLKAPCIVMKLIIVNHLVYF